MSIEQAIAEFNTEIATFNHGTKAAPTPGEAEWYRLRALTLGRAYLVQVQRLGAHSDPLGGKPERLYRAMLASFKNAEVPPEVVVEREGTKLGLHS